MSRLKKIFLILATIAIILGGIFGALYSVVMKARTDLNNATEPMITNMVASGWNLETIKEYSSPALLDWFNKNDASAIFSDYREYGRLSEYHGIGSFHASSEEAIAQATADFDNGPILIEWALIRHDGEWRIKSITLTPQ